MEGVIEMGATKVVTDATFDHVRVGQLSDDRGGCRVPSW
jgi:hypothetical protein